MPRFEASNDVSGSFEAHLSQSDRSKYRRIAVIAQKNDA
jgi:hypothetical protein